MISELHQKLRTVRLGVAAPQNRSVNPVVATYILQKRDNLAKMTPAAINYSTLDELCKEGYVQESSWDGFSNWTLTYNGNLKLYELDGFDLTFWRGKNKQYVCCNKAIPRHCVCFISTDCPDHGYRCNGTHD